MILVQRFSACFTGFQFNPTTQSAPCIPLLVWDVFRVMVPASGSIAHPLIL